MEEQVQEEVEDEFEMEFGDGSDLLALEKEGEPRGGREG